MTIPENIGYWGSFRNTCTRYKLIIFGDEIGLLIFIGSLLFFGLYWRIGIFVTDNWTIANTFVALVDGHLYIQKPLYGPPGVRTPGLHFFNGRVFGRNYGQLFLSLPIYYTLQAIALLTDLRITLAGAWSLGLLAFSLRLGAVLGYRDRFALLGSVGALIAFGLNTGFAFPLEKRMTGIIALQLSTMVAGGLIGVFQYRILSRMYDAPIGVFAGVTTVLATPVAFWASIPKRHIFTAVLALAVLYFFYTSRVTNSTREALIARSAAYASVGLSAWIHAPEALVLLVVLVPFDLTTAQSNSLDRMAIVGAVFFISLLPFLVTNQLIAGNPLEPPRFLSASPASDAPHGHVVSTPDGGTSEGSSTPSGSVGTSVPSGGGDNGPSAGNGPVSIGAIVSWLSATTANFYGMFTTLTNLIQDGLKIATVNPSRIFHTFIRSAPAKTRATPTDLTILETTPIFGVLISVPLLMARRITDPTSSSKPNWSPVRKTDAFAFTYVVGFTLLYLHRLPLHAMWTVRYLIPVVPFGIYFLGRLGPVRNIIAKETRLLCYSYGGLTLIGGQFLIVFLISLQPTRGEVIQFHGMLGLGAAAIVGIGILLHMTGIMKDTRLGAISIAIALAAGTLFVILTGVEYYVYDHFALAMTELLSRAIPLF